MAGLNHAMHKIDPPRGYKGSKWVDETGSYENNNNESFKATSSDGEKYTYIEEVVILGKSKSTVELDKFLTYMSISSDFKEASLEYIDENILKSKSFKYGLKPLGTALGYYSIYSSGRNFYYNRTPQNAVKLALSVLSVTRYVNPVLGITLGIADATGFTDWTLNQTFKR